MRLLPDRRQLLPWDYYRGLPVIRPGSGTGLPKTGQWICLGLNITAVERRFRRVRPLCLWGEQSLLRKKGRACPWLWRWGAEWGRTGRRWYLQRHDSRDMSSIPRFAESWWRFCCRQRRRTPTCRENALYPLREPQAP